MTRRVRYFAGALGFASLVSWGSACSPRSQHRADDLVDASAADSSPAWSSVPTTVTVNEDLVEPATDFARAFCRRQVDCRFGMFLEIFQSEDECTEYMATRVARWGSTSASAVTAASLRSCADSVSAASCASLRTPLWGPPECGIAAGVRQASEPCLHQRDCAPGLWCDATGDSVACGVCLPAKPLGDMCSDGVQCGPNGTCDPTSGVCVALRGPGETCWDGGPQCDERQDLYCANGSCTRHSAVGEQCGGPNGCATRGSVYCDLSTDTCKELPYGSVGADCGVVPPSEAGGFPAPASCQSTYCKMSSDPQAPGTCTSWGGNGDACNPTTQPCGVKYDCSSDGVCVAAAPYTYSECR